jgi:D-glycero-alpha-D-manno-heptose-7-phosphate kinase
LVFTGLTRKADDIEKIKIKKIDLNQKYLNKINQIAIQASEILKSDFSINTDEIGNLLDETWHYKKKLSPQVTNQIIDKIYLLGKKNGALGGKLLGAGSGGFLLFYVNQDKRNKLIKALKNFSCVDFNFVNFGSAVTKL